MSLSIRSRLLLLILSVLVPGLLGLSWMVLSTLKAERAANERLLRDTSRALSLVVDRELARRATIGQVLAQSRWLDGALGPAEQAGFEDQARRALAGIDGWIELHGSGGRILDTRSDAVADVEGLSPPLADGFSLVALRLAGTPDAHAALVQPVIRQGQTLYNLHVSLRPREMQAIIDRQGLPEGWVGAVIDNEGQVVARHPHGERHVGRLATADLRQHMSQATEGLTESVSLDGVRSMAFFSRSPMGWTYVSAMPKAQFAGAASQAVIHIVVGALVLLALSMAAATWLARRIAEPVHALKDAALLLQAGDAVAVRSTGLVECDEVVLALAEASETIRHGRDDLERQVQDAVQQTRLAEQRISQGQRVEALGRLTGGVAHDFNNLLGVISNSAHLMQRHPTVARELQGPVSATLRAVNLGSQLTQHLMRFAGQRPVSPRALHLTQALPDAQDLLSSVLGRRVEVSVRVEPGTLPVQADPGELELALINLALNARDAMPRGGQLRLQARNADAEDLRSLQGPLSDGRPFVLMTVGDTGTGMPPEVVEHAFDPFFTTKPLGQGTGLGLSQVHGFCVQAGGSARIDSTPGLGTTVSLLLPAQLATPADPSGIQDSRSGSPSAALAADPVLGAPATATLAGQQVLLVEDNPTLAEATAALLRSHGAQVQHVGSAVEALDRLGRLPAQAVDVVLSDVVMPGPIDGLALARQLRQERPALPVVLITGFSAAATAASDEFTVLRKPCPEGELLAALTGHRGSRASASAPA